MAGLTSRCFQSGEVDLSGRVSRMRGGMLRGALHDVALAMRRVCRNRSPLAGLGATACRARTPQEGRCRNSSISSSRTLPSRSRNIWSLAGLRPDRLTPQTVGSLSVFHATVGRMAGNCAISPSSFQIPSALPTNLSPGKTENKTKCLFW